MKVNIKQFDVAMELKTNGMEVEVKNGSDEHLGDLIVSKSGIEWCNGRIHRGNGVKLTWTEFIAFMMADDE